MRTLNGRPIELICHLCAIRHTVVKQPLIQPTGQSGLCDVCEILGPQNAPQTVFDVLAFGDVRPESYHNDVLIVFEHAE